MHATDFGDMADLKNRLQVLTQEADRSLVTVFGSGLSNAVLPDVTKFTELFRDQMPPQGLEKFDKLIQPLLGTPLGYQNAASLLTYQAGERAVLRAIRSGVLLACHDVKREEISKIASDENRCREYVNSGAWNIPLGYQRFAQFFSGLSGRIRGPIITTNFDPLIEIALQEEGIPAGAIPVPVDSAPTPGALRERTDQPVLHIHGYWTGKAASNVPARLTAERPQLDQVLQELLRNSVVLVVGYSGWEDGFMRSLRARILNEAALLEAEVLWTAYAKDPNVVISSGELKDLLPAPGFNLYLDVDGHELFKIANAADSAQKKSKPSPYGFSRVPSQAASPTATDARFADGGQPGWSDAIPGHWPELTSTRTLKENLLQSLDSGGGSGAIALGPLGEGKSLALRQVAMNVAESRRDWNVLWREAGAPSITGDWLEQVRESFGPTLVCIDEADLVADELINTQHLWNRDGSGISFLLACHDRLWYRTGKRLGTSIRETLFHGITEDDARNIAVAWKKMGILPKLKEGEQDITSAADRLTASAGLMSDSVNSLFGAVLDVRYGTQLGDRVEDLIKRLREIKLAEGISLGDVFAGICLMQDTLDTQGSLGRGASRPVIAAMVGLDTVFADGKILETLGREAAVTFAGTRVYSRHPAIARTALQCVHRDGTAQKIYELVGQAGGALRMAGTGDEEGYRDAYLLSRNLSGSEAVWAATGAVKGAGSRLLEPRVTLLSAMRRNGESRGLEYARYLAPRVSDYDDFRGAIRAFLVEFSHTMRKEGYAQTATGLAALALGDNFGFTLDTSRAAYALVALARSAQSLQAQIRESQMASVPIICYVLLDRIQGEASSRLGWVKNQVGDLEALQNKSASDLCSRLNSALKQTAKSAAQEANLGCNRPSELSYDMLRHLTESLAF